MGAETHGGLGITGAHGRVRPGHKTAEPKEYFCGCSVAGVWEGGQGQGLVLAGTRHGRCGSGQCSSAWPTVRMPRATRGDGTHQLARP